MSNIPEYVVYAGKPVHIKSTSQGLEVLVFDSDTQEFVKNSSFLVEILHDRNNLVEVVDGLTFQNTIQRLKGEKRHHISSRDLNRRIVRAFTPNFAQSFEQILNSKKRFLRMEFSNKDLRSQQKARGVSIQSTKVIMERPILEGMAIKLNSILSSRDSSWLPSRPTKKSKSEIGSLHSLFAHNSKKGRAKRNK